MHADLSRRNRLVIASALMAGLCKIQVGFGANTPITLTTGTFNDNVIVNTTPVASATYGGFDTENGISFWGTGYNSSNALPASGLFNSSVNSQTQFQLQPYTGETAMLINADNYHTTNGVSTVAYAPAYGQTGTITFATPQAYTTIALLDSAAIQTGASSFTMSYTLNFSDGTPSYNASGTAGFTAYEWNSTTSAAVSSLGRVWVQGSNLGKSAGTNWSIHENDITIPAAYITHPISSISFFDPGQGSYSAQVSGYPANSFAVFAASGSVTPNNLTYIGTDPTTPATWDTTSHNFEIGTTPVAFSTGNIVTFDDTATGSHNVNIPSAVTPSAVIFNNNNSSYSISGAAIAGTAPLSLTGTGKVTLNNSSTYSGITTISSGTLLISATGAISSPTVNVASGGLLVLQGGTSQIPATTLITNSGSFNASGGESATFSTYNSAAGSTTYIDSSSTLSVGSGSIAGNLNSAGGSFVKTTSGTVVLSGSNTFNGTMNLSAGIVNFNSSAAISTQTSVLNAGGTFQFSTNYNSDPSAQFSNAPNQAFALDTNGQSVILATGLASAGGSLNKLGAGTLVLAGTSSYTGTTTVTAGTLMAGVNNPISPSSGLVFPAGGTGTFDLNSLSVSVGSLSGPSTGVITNSSGLLATLTVNTPAATTATYSGLITDGNGRTSLVYSGPGTQVLNGANSYSAGTLISGGKLASFNPLALGTGAISLGGGTVSLGGSVGFTLNGSATQTGPTFTMTDGGGSENGSVFSNNKVTISDTAGFTASFIYQASNPQTAAVSWADGITFVLQNDSRGPLALGGNGGSLGYAANSTYTSITPSAAIALNLYSAYSGQTYLTTNGSVSPAAGNTFNAWQLDGVSPQPQDDMTRTVGDPIYVTLTYSGTSLTETLTDNVTNTSFTNTYTIDLAQTLGGSSGGSIPATIGFTGSTGGSVATQNISNFTFTSGTSNPLGSVSYANNIQALAGTSSGIELNSSTGQPIVQIGTLSIQAGALVKLSSVNTAATRGALVTSSLSIAGTAGAWTGRLDLANNTLDVQGGSLATITSQLKQGYNGGNWNGTGINSTAAAADSTHLTALGSLLNDNGSGVPLYGNGGAIASTFSGIVPALDDVLVKYTYYGDANLDGQVDGSDYSRIDAAFLNNQSSSSPTLTGWYNGDFNYDGVIDGSDYTLIDNAFNSQGASLATAIAEPTALVSAVPEPASIGLIAATLTLLARRRKPASVCVACSNV